MANHGEVVLNTTGMRDWAPLLKLLRRARIWANNAPSFNQPIGASEMHAAYRRRAKKRARGGRK